MQVEKYSDVLWFVFIIYFLIELWPGQGLSVEEFSHIVFWIMA